MSTLWAIGASVRALAQSLVASGHQVIAADLFCDLDLQKVAQRTQRIVDYPRDLLQLVDEVEADAFIYTGGLENEPDLIDVLAQRLPLLGNPGPVLRHVRDVFFLQDVLTSGGFRMPAISQELSVLDSGRWLRKAAHSSGGLRVAWAAAPQKSLHSNEYLQAFVEGPVYGASFHSSGERVEMLGITRQLGNCPWTQSPRFHYAGSIGPVWLPGPLQQEVVRLGQFLANEFSLRSWFGVDLVVDSHDELYVLEVNPRYTASMELLERQTSAVAAKAVLYADRAMSVAAEFSQRLLQRGDVADIPAPASEIVAGSPVCTLFARGVSQALVLAELQAKTQDLAAELAAMASADAARR